MPPTAMQTEGCMSVTANLEVSRLSNSCCRMLVLHPQLSAWQANTTDQQGTSMGLLQPWMCTEGYSVAGFNSSFPFRQGCSTPLLHA